MEYEIATDSDIEKLKIGDKIKWTGETLMGWESQANKGIEIRAIERI